MKRSSNTLHAFAFGGLALLTTLFSVVGCEQNIRVDNPDENAGILGPKGIIRGSATYIGPAPCIRDGNIEGALVILIFEAANPPPPDGLASTAVNFATVPGERLFANYPRPKTGPGSPGNKESLCGSVDGPSVVASTEYSVQQLNAGRYQVRAFYSRQNRFTPLFNFANLPLAGDVFGGALVDPRAAVPAFAPIEVGVLSSDKVAAAAGTLVIPPLGFVRESVGVTLVGALRSNRPFFHVLYDKSRSFDVTTPVKTDLQTEAAEQKPITGAAGAALGRIEFRQDHITTSQQNPFDAAKGESCIGNPNPECDIFKFSQSSFPQIRFKYGFPGDKDAPTGGLPDAWLAKNAKPREPFFVDRVRPFYGIDPLEFADIPTSQHFALTRNFNAAGEPEIVRDNDTLESLAKIAEIFPTVVLSKLAEDDFGRVLEPPRSQTDPIVVIQTITLRDYIGPDGKPLPYGGSMKATSEGAITGGALQKDGKRDDTLALNKRNVIESVDEFTTLVRPSVVCIYPQDELRGVLVTPAQKDPNPLNPDATLVNRSKILVLRANRVKDVKFGCLPPGTYSINVVYPTGQAWSFPNVSGTCSYKLPPIGTDAVPNEECNQGNNPLPKQILDAVDIGKGFLKRPLLQSQTVWQTDADGKYKLDGAGRRIAQSVVIRPSDRCGHYETKPGVIVSIADVDSGAVPKGTAKWVNNPVNEDTSLDDGAVASPFSANGVLDPGEDKNGNTKLDLKVPNACVYKYTDYLKLPDADKAK